MFSWFKKQKKDPNKSYLATGKYSVKQVDHILGRYAVINEKEKDRNWFTISYFNKVDEANRLAEAYNRIAGRDA